MECLLKFVMSALPSRWGNTKVKPRAEFNACGETSSASTTYTGVAVRRFCELPVLEYKTRGLRLIEELESEYKLLFNELSRVKR